MKTRNIEHLKWIYGRMVHVHKENENLDYMIKFREIIHNEGKPILYKNTCDVIFEEASKIENEQCPSGLIYCKTGMCKKDY